MKVMNIHIAILHLTNLQELLVNYETLFEEVCEFLPLEIICFSQIFLYMFSMFLLKSYHLRVMMKVRELLMFNILTAAILSILNLNHLLN